MCCLRLELLVFEEGRGCKGLALVVFQVSSWGGYVFLINLIPLHVLALMITGRFSHRIYLSYSVVSGSVFQSVSCLTLW